MTLKQNFQLENIPFVYLHDILKRLVAKVCFDASFMCLCRFVAFNVTFDNLCCLTRRCGLQPRSHYRVTNRSFQTGPKEFVLHFEVVFVV